MGFMVDGLRCGGLFGLNADDLDGLGLLLGVPLVLDVIGPADPARGEAGDDQASEGEPAVGPGDEFGHGKNTRLPDRGARMVRWHQPGVLEGDSRYSPQSARSS